MHVFNDCLCNVFLLRRLRSKCITVVHRGYVLLCYCCVCLCTFRYEKVFGCVAVFTLRRTSSFAVLLSAAFSSTPCKKPLKSSFRFLSTCLMHIQTPFLLSLYIYLSIYLYLYFSPLQGFPTLMYFSHGNMHKYSGLRKIDTLLAYAKVSGVARSAAGQVLLASCFLLHQAARVFFSPVSTVVFRYNMWRR